MIKLKEDRLKEVLKLIEEENVNKPRINDIPNNIPWSNIDSMTPSEIMECVNNFNFSAKEFFATEDISPTEVISTDDIKNYIMEKHSIMLPPTLVSEIDSFVDSGIFNAKSVCKFIDKSILDVNSNGYKWKDNYSNDICSAYVNDDEILCNSDIIIKNNNNRYEAFKITDNNNLKFLGSETELSSIKNRVEQYVCNLHIKNRFKEINDLFNHLYVDTKPTIIEYYKDNFIVDYKGIIEICTYDKILVDIHEPTKFREEFNTLKEAKCHINSKEDIGNGLDI